MKFKNSAFLLTITYALLNLQIRFTSRVVTCSINVVQVDSSVNILAMNKNQEGKRPYYVWNVNRYYYETGEEYLRIPMFQIHPSFPNYIPRECDHVMVSPDDKTSRKILKKTLLNFPNMGFQTPKINYMQNGNMDITKPDDSNMTMQPRFNSPNVVAFVEVERKFYQTQKYTHIYFLDNLSQHVVNEILNHRLPKLMI